MYLINFILDHMNGAQKLSRYFSNLIKAQYFYKGYGKYHFLIWSTFNIYCIKWLKN
jgi:hypothetical protein